MTSESSQTYEFNVRVTWIEGKEGTIFLDGKADLPLSSAVQWNGKADMYSPHDLFISSITGCYITTFVSMMKRIKQPLIAQQASGQGILAKHPEGGWHFTDIYITLDILVPMNANLSQVKRAVTLTEKYCHISRSVNCKVHLEPKITQRD